MINDVKKINYVKRIYKRTPDKYLNLSDIEGWPRDEEWMRDLPHLNHGMKRRRGTVCPCVYEKYSEVTNRAIVNYVSELLESGVLIVLSIKNVKGVISMIDGVHTALAYDKLGIGAQELVRSRGYFTPKAFEIFRGAEAAKAAWFQRTQDLDNNLNTKIDNIADKSSRYKNR